MSGVIGDSSVSREQGQTHLLLAIGIENLDAFEPSLLLTVIDLAQVKDMPLHDASIAASAAFHDGPVTMLLAIFESAVTFQMHARRALYGKKSDCEETWSAPQPLSENRTQRPNELRRRTR